MDGCSGFSSRKQEGPGFKLESKADVLSYVAVASVRITYLAVVSCGLHHSVPQMTLPFQYEH